jgi:hypothetical protein
LIFNFIPFNFPPDPAPVSPVSAALPADAGSAVASGIRIRKWSSDRKSVPADLGPELRRRRRTQLQEPDEGLPGEDGEVTSFLLKIFSFVIYFSQVMLKSAREMHSLIQYKYIQ